MVCTPLPPLVLHRAEGFFSRLAGVWERKLGPHEGLWLVPCRAVHTLGLRQPLDVVFLDRQGRILRYVLQLPPNRWAWHVAAHSVVELPGGYCAHRLDFAQALRKAAQMCATTP